jgi:hypothetical protein
VSSYWDALERALSEAAGAEDATATIISNGWAPETSRAGIKSLLDDHWGTYAEDDNEWDYYCVCGKWLERDTYDMPDHQSSLLEDTDLLTPGRPWICGGGG